jgi:hypothetical protein
MPELAKQFKDADQDGGAKENDGKPKESEADPKGCHGLSSPIVQVPHGFPFKSRNLPSSRL